MERCSIVHTIIQVPETVDLRFDPRTPARVGIRITQVCVECGHLPELIGLKIHDHDLARISAPYKLGKAGNARNLGFPELRIIASDIAPAKVIQTGAQRRIDENVDRQKVGYLNGLLRNRMGFSRGSWPKSVDCPALDHPIILHPGLTEKFAEKHDVAHIRFAAYAAAVIKQPMEVWYANENGRDVFRILGCLRVGPDKLFYMQVVVEGDNHICDTAFVVDRDQRIEAYRESKPLLLAWQLKI
jgi:hypothetical protein